jgi:hypothetical protein
MQVLWPLVPDEMGLIIIHDNDIENGGVVVAWAVCGVTVGCGD